MENIQFVERDFIREVTEQVTDLADLNTRWTAWVRWYNAQRPHSSLGDVPPARCYQASRRVAPAEVERLCRVEVQRKVARDATIILAGQRYPVPGDLMGHHVWIGLLGNRIVIEHAGQAVATFRS